MCSSQRNRSFALNKRYVLELLKLNDKKDLHDQLLEWKMPKFPLNGNILLEKGCPAGKKIQFVLAKLRKNWVDSAFSLQQNELIGQMPDILESYTKDERAGNKRKKTEKNK